MYTGGGTFSLKTSFEPILKIILKQIVINSNLQWIRTVV